MLKQLLLSVLFAIAYVQASEMKPLDGWVPIFHRSDAPAGWTTLSEAPLDDRVKFIVALKQRNLDALSAKYEAVTDPNSPEWTQFMTAEEITNLVRPAQKDHDRVVDWFKERGATNVVSFGDALEMEASVGDAQKFFNTRLHVFGHDDGRKVVRQHGKAHIHAEVSEMVDVVEGLYNFPVPHFSWKAGEKAVTDGSKRGLKQFGTPTAYVPQSTDNLYSKGRDETPEQGSQGVIEFQGQSFDPAALQKYAQAVNIPISGDTVVVGPNNSQQPGTEATLDIQWMGGTNNGAKNWFWLESGQNWLLSFATHFFATSKVPLINSISYGWAENDQCQIAVGPCSTLGVNSEQYVKRVNTEFQKIGLRGISLMAASGDSGANGRSDPGCSKKTLEPGFPGASPFITTVGATQVNNPETALKNPPPACANFACVSGGGEEVAVSYKVANFASGGGFSNYAKRPKYQDKAVSAYLSSGVKLPPSTYFNAANRGYPDLASVGTGIIIYSGGLQTVGGTSASCPTVAGIMGLLNAHKLKKTGTALGPLNPFLYDMHEKSPHCFNDITAGDNKCTEQGCGIFNSCDGYDAAKGWDPVTGLGSVNYDCMVQHLDDLIASKK